MTTETRRSATIVKDAHFELDSLFFELIPNPATWPSRYRLMCILSLSHSAPPLSRPIVMPDAFKLYKYTFFLLHVVSANIIFHWVQPSCNPASKGRTGCLRGQICETDGSCSLSQAAKLRQKRDYSTDGRCGPVFGYSICEPNSTVYRGTCCSQYGWCGDTADHCGSGCVSGCTSSSPGSSSIVAIGEPTVGQAFIATATSPPIPPSALPVTTDGSCGSFSGGAACGDWSQGACCSMYGFCGNTTAHCGDGCQSGPCTNGSSQPALGPHPAPMNPNPGHFEIVGRSGVPPMHAGLMENGRVVFLDKVENYTQLNHTDGQFAYSAEYDTSSNNAVPLAYKTNAFCSGGIFLADGRMLNIGGNAPLPSVDPTVGDGFTGIRYLNRSSIDPSLDGQDWSEPGNKLNSPRWYPTAQILPDATVFVASGSLNGGDPAVAANNNPTYEMLDAQGDSMGESIPMGILENNQPYYMYPFIHLLPDSSLFVFVAKSVELFNVSSGSTIKTLDDLPGDFRTYPNTGGSVLLPLSSENNWNPEVVICGGGPYQALSAPADASCGRISPLAVNPEWELDSMPEGRVMVEGTLLPDGTVIWLNGCSQGAQGFGFGADPAYEALLYNPSQPLGQRFTTDATSTIARLYHSVALLLLDGTIMVAGSNPVEQPLLMSDAQNPYVTEFRVEIYTPPYLSGNNSNRRPTNISISSNPLHANGSTFNVTFVAPEDAGGSSVVLYYGGFVTHSLHMGQRLVVLDTAGWTAGFTEQTLMVTMPPSSNIAPPGPWVIYVLCDGVPGIGQFVSVA